MARHAGNGRAGGELLERFERFERFMKFMKFMKFKRFNEFKRLGFFVGVENIQTAQKFVVCCLLLEAFNLEQTFIQYQVIKA